VTSLLLMQRGFAPAHRRRRRRPAVLLALALVIAWGHPAGGRTEDVAGAWHFLARACGGRPDGGAGCLRLWRPPEAADDPPEGSEEIAAPLRFDIDFPMDGDVVVCNGAIDFACPVDIWLYTWKPSTVRGGEVLHVRLDRRLVRSFVVHPPGAGQGGCPNLVGAAVQEDEVSQCAYLLHLRDIRQGGTYTLQIDLVGVPFNIFPAQLSSKVTFRVEMQGPCSAGGVQATVLHFGSFQNLTRALSILHDAGLVYIVRTPALPDAAWFQVVQANQDQSLDRLLGGIGCRILAQRIVLVDLAQARSAFDIHDERTWHGFHVVLDDRLSYPPDYVKVAVANVDFFGRGAVLGFVGLSLAPAAAANAQGLEPVDPRLHPDSRAPSAWTDVLHFGYVAFHSSVLADGARDAGLSSILSQHFTLRDVIFARYLHYNKVPRAAPAYPPHWAEFLKGDAGAFEARVHAQVLGLHAAELRAQWRPMLELTPRHFSACDASRARLLALGAWSEQHEELLEKWRTAGGFARRLMHRTGRRAREGEEVGRGRRRGGGRGGESVEQGFGD